MVLRNLYWPSTCYLAEDETVKLLMVAPEAWQHQEVSAFDTSISDLEGLRK